MIITMYFQLNVIFMKISGVAEKSMLTSSTVAVFQTRVVLRNRLVIVNKLVADLHFWNEVQKYLHLRKKILVKNVIDVNATIVVIWLKILLHCVDRTKLL